MYLTRSGRTAAAMVALTLLASLLSGNNLLYLLYSLVLSALALSALSSWAMLRGVTAEALFPERMFRGVPFRLGIRLINAGPFRAAGLSARLGDAAAAAPPIGPGDSAELSLPASLPHRGRNLMSGLRLECAYPFGLLGRRVGLRGVVGNALPRPRLVRAAAELSADASETGAPRPRKGAGDELYGLREYAPGDDARMINWKVAARTGRTLVNEFAEPSGTKVLVRVEAAGGDPSSESQIVEGASACRHFIDQGREVGLKTPESEIGFGRGILHLDKLLAALSMLGPGKTPREAVPPAGSAQAPEAVEEPDSSTVLHLGALIVCLALFLIEEIHPLLPAALIPLVLVGAWLDRGRGPRLPEILWAPLSLAVLAYVLLFDWWSSGITLANTHLLIYMLVNRILGPKSPRDLDLYFLVLFLAFFLISGQTISPWYFPLFVLYAGFSAFRLMRGAASQGLAPAGVWAPLAACLALTGLTFAATPRIEPLRRMNAFAAMGLDKRRPKQDFVVQFTEHVSLGFFGRLKRSSARVLRVRPLVPYSPAPGGLRVRGGAFDRFDGRSWSKSPIDFRYRLGGGNYTTSRGRAWAPRRGEMLLFPPGGEPDRTLPAMEFSVYPLNSSVLFTTHGIGLLREPRLAAYFDYAGEVRFGSPYLGGVEYTVYGSRSGPTASSGNIEGYDRILGERFLQVPGLDPRIRELALRLTRNARSPSEKIVAVLRFFGEGFDYSDFSDDPDRDLGDFLFRARRGNCEYFATGAAILLRHAGVPARLVTGFLTEDFNEYGGFYDVRQGSAHAWAEAFAGGRWITVDATPAASEFSRRRDAAWEKLGRWFAAAQIRWYRHVIGYDLFMQRNTFHRIQVTLAGPAFELWLKRAAKGFGLLLLLAAAAIGIRAAARRLGRPRPNRFETAVKLAAAAGLARRPHETPREFASGAAASLGELGPLPELAELHYLERYSSRGLSPDEEARADALLDRLREVLK